MSVGKSIKTSQANYESALPGELSESESELNGQEFPQALLFREVATPDWGYRSLMPWNALDWKP